MDSLSCAYDDDDDDDDGTDDNVDDLPRRVDDLQREAPLAPSATNINTHSNIGR